MEVTGRQIVNLLRRNLSIKQVVLSGLSADSRTIQITTIYKYGLYVSARQHYFELDLNISKLPKYALWNVLYINIEQTIKHLRTKS